MGTQKLNNKANKAFDLLKNKKTWEKRIQILVENKEYGYALLNLWNMIESTIKLLWYYEHIHEPYPETLDNELLKTDWPIIGDLAQSHPDELKKIFKICPPETKNKAKCLREVRNEIVHLNSTSRKQDYNKYYSDAQTIFELLSEKLGTEDDFKEKLIKTPKPSKKKKQANKEVPV